MFKVKGWMLACILALPLALAALGVYLLTFDLLHRVTTGANEADRARTQQTVHAAFAATERQMATVAMDNSLWDDAVRNVYDPLNEDWIFETWGVTTETAVVYDAIFIVDREKAQPVSGFQGGKPFRPHLNEFFGESFTELLDSLPNDFSRHDAAATLVKTVEGLAVVSAAPVMPTGEDLKISQAHPNFFVLVRYLTPSFVASLGQGYVVQDLRLQPASEAGGDTLLMDKQGHIVATATWRDGKPGDAALAAVKMKAMVALLFLVLVMAAIGVLCWYLFRSLAKRELAARRDALSDPLTGLPNRVALAQETQRLNRASPHKLAIAFADLDGFKDVNDQYDHHVGDALICEVARVMSGLIGPNAFLARAGGDEFVAVFEGPSAPGDASTFAERLIVLLRKPMDLDGRFASVGVSIGLVIEQSGALTTAELMRRADVAMYEAKSRGKNRLCNYSTAIDEDRQDNGRIVTELRRLISERRLRAFYQPIVDAKTLEIVAVEALARWPEDASFPCMPDKFISLAEKNGLIDDLGDFMLRQACLDAAAWPGIRVSINISPAQLRNPGFVSRALATIETAGMSADRVEFEVTEGILLDNWDRTRVQFQQLQSAGVCVALDDFGAGYSSVGYLKSIHFDRIKIDRSIVSNVLLGQRQQSIVQGTVLMATGMSAKVTAEGVESADEVALLRLVGCSELQGYLFHKPMPAAAISKLLAPHTAELATA